METEKIQFEHKGIGDILAYNRLAVPPNQREYSWEDQHVYDLFHDFANAITTNKGRYFLGTIVLTNTGRNIPEVSDGQQRLATTTILLAAIRDYFYNNGDTARVTSIQECLKTTDLDTGDNVARLRLNVDDNEFFLNYIIATPNEPGRKIQPIKDKKSHERIKNASKIAKQFITDILEPHSPATRTPILLDWVKFIKTGAEVIVLRVPDHLNAFKMFETLNDRGLKASQADLLKNHLLSLAGDRRIEAQHLWSEMIGIIESIGIQDDATVTFLHHVMITKTGPTRGQEVFDKVSQMINNQTSSLGFLHDVASAANDYAALFNSDHSKWNQYGSKTRQCITTINRDLKVEQIRPLMFAIARHFTMKEAQEALYLLVCWAVRYLIIGTRGGLLDRHYAIHAQSIATKKIKTAQELTKAMDEIIPNDALFESSFAEARVSHAYLARYFLRALETYAKRLPDPEFIPTNDEQVVNLEHILPENPQDKWPNVDHEIATAYYKRLGNMVILQAKKNSIAGNSSYKEKKPVLLESGYLLTQNAGKYTSWGIKEINKRQKELAKLALKTWPAKL